MYCLQPPCMMFTATLFLTLTFASTLSECSNVLLLSPFCSRSHKNSIDPAINELASRGHKITEVAMYVNSNSTGILQYELKAMVEELLKRVPNPFKPNEEQNIFFLLHNGIHDMVNHKNSIDPAIDVLVSRGHTVTELSMYVNGNSTGIRQYELKRLGEELGNQIPNPFNKSAGNNLFANLYHGISEFARLTYEDPEFQKFLMESQTEKYDVIIVSSFINEFILPVAHRFGAPIIYWNPGTLLPYLAWTFNVPYPSSYVTSSLVAYKAPLTYFQRFSNTAINLAITLGRNYLLVPKIESVVRELNPGFDFPPLLDIERNVSLMLVNSHVSMENARPIMPNVINVGAMHCRPRKPVSKELESFISKSGDAGFIVFSLGSVVRGDQMPQWMIDTFLTAFGKLKQQVIWKFESKLDKVPNNVLVSKWLPQQDLLGHPKCRLAFLHGGLNGLQEAVYHGVPVLGMPLGADRDSNLAKFVVTGMAEVIDWTTMTEEILSNKLDQLLSNPKYQETAKVLSSQLRDNMDSPKETAAFWIEYVIRNKGAHHLKSFAGELNFFQYFMLDVLLVIFSVLIIITIFAFWITRYIFVRLLRKFRKSNKTKTS